MLKILDVPLPRSRAVRVIYKVIKDECTFTQIAPIEPGLTVNNAEFVAVAIAKNEKRTVNSLCFFDLQTRYGFGPGLSRNEPGDFEYVEVTVEKESGGKAEGFSVTNWTNTACPRAVIRAFKPFIDGTPRQIF